MNGFCPNAVIFDQDGTLIDSLPGIEFSCRAAFDACDLTYPAVDLRRLIGPPIRTILSKLANTRSEKVLDRLESAFRMSYDTEGWAKSSCYPGAGAALESLREAGLRLFVVTNKPLHVTLRTLKMTSIAPLFEQIVARDSRVPHYESKAAIAASLIDSCGLAPEKCLLVGDTEEDARAASQCSLRFAHVSHGYGTIGVDFGSRVDLKLGSFPQLLKWLGLEFAHDR